MVTKGYLYMEPPLMIRKKILEGVYSSAEIDQMAYKIEGEDLYLIATSEHPVIGMFINKTLKRRFAFENNCLFYVFQKGDRLSMV